MERLQMFRQGKVLLFSTCFLLLLASVFLACHKDLALPSSEVTASWEEKGVFDAAYVQAAQQWFEEMIARTANPSQLKPKWKEALIYGNKIEVPILIDGKKIRRSMTTEDTNHLSKQRLVIYKRGLNKYDSYILDFVPAKDYNVNMNSINVSNYSEKKFNGQVLISGVDNKLIGTYFIKNGERSKFAKSNSSASNAVQLRGWHQVCVQIPMLFCNEGWGTERDPITNQWIYVLKWVCEWGSELDCFWVDDGDDPCDGPNPPPNCTGGDDCGLPWPFTPASCDPCNDPLPPADCERDRDPCNGPYPPANCGDDTGPCKATSATSRNFATLRFGRIDYLTNPYVHVQVGTMTFTHTIGVSNCPAAQYEPGALTYTTDAIVPGEFEAKNYNFTKGRTEAINPACSQCGFKTFVRCQANAIFKVYTGPWGGLPLNADLDQDAGFFVK